MTKIIKKELSGESSKEIIPQDTKSSNQIDTWIEMRKDFTKKVVSIMVEGKDFHKIKFGGKEVQVLAKGGAEKVASALGWKAEFIKDSETYEMLGSPAGTLCYICNLKNGEFVGQGRGARNIRQDQGDVNKTIKMAQKSAFIDAVLRGSGLSDLFTQDLEQQEESSTEPPYNYQSKLSAKPVQQPPQDTRKPTEKQSKLIKDLAIQKKLTQTQIMEMAKGKTPSQLIEALFQYKAYEQTEELPIIQQEMTTEERELADSLDF